MLEDLNKEIPFLYKQYEKKKQKLTKKIFNELDEKTKSEFKSLFYTADEMQDLIKNVREGEFLSPYEISESALPTLGKLLVTLPMVYVFDELIREMFLVYLITLFESFLELLISK